jgi:hypothetical protein
MIKGIPLSASPHFNLLPKNTTDFPYAVRVVSMSFV